MVDPIRIPLVESLEPRLSDSDKDGMASNVYYDKQQDGKIFATKRPGIASYIEGFGEAQGIYGWNNQVFSWYFPQLSWVKPIWTGTTFCTVSSNDVTIQDDYSLVSTDGLFWRQSLLPLGTTGLSSGLWYGIAWNGNTFVAVSRSNLYAATSPDGRTWTQRTLTNRSWSNVVAGGTRFVAVAQNAFSATSTDNGINWAETALGFGLTDVTYSSTSGLFCATRNGTSTGVYTSADGLAWTFRDIGASALSARATIAANSTRFVTINQLSAGVDTTKGYTSTDGIAWTEFTLPFDNSGFVSLNWTGSLFVAISETEVAYSSNGTTWSKATLPILPHPDDSFYSVVGGNSSILVALSSGSFPNDYAYSTDGGVTWTLDNLGAFSPFPVIT
jgi:hypothetical protein